MNGEFYYGFVLTNLREFGYFIDVCEVHSCWLIKKKKNTSEIYDL